MMISKTVRHGLTTYPILSIMLLAAMADIASAATYGDHQIATSISAESGIKPAYYQDAGEYLETGATLNYSSKLPITFTLKQTITTVDEAEAPNLAGTRPDDTLGSVALKTPIEIKAIKAKLGASIGGTVYGGSDRSQYRTLKSSLGPTISLTIPRGKWTTAIGQTYRYSLYGSKRRPSAVANSPHTFISSLAVGYSLPLDLTLSASYATYRYINFDSQNNYAYLTAAEISRAQTENLALTLGLVTKDLELKDGRTAGVYLYKEDLSQIYFGASFSI